MHRENTEPDCVHPLKWISILALISMVSAQTVQVKPVLSYNLQKPFVGFTGIWIDS